MSLSRWLQSVWWRAAAPPAVLLPLAALYGSIAAALAKRRRARAQRLPVPVIVVGNIAVGGSGKTPVTLALIELLRDLGHTPGVLSRGYGGMGPFPLLVDTDTSPELAGDEPALIAQRSHAPVCVAPNRVEAGLALLREHPRVDVLICDDGLQHYALGRDLEFCVIDGRRGHGNGHRLPAGPLRETVARAQQCALQLVNGGDAMRFGAQAVGFALDMDHAIHLASGEQRPLAAFAGVPVDAVAGIGDPQRFFAQLQSLGLTVRGHAFADHHVYQERDFDFADRRPVLMTEKDAVKCRHLDIAAEGGIWSVPVTLRWSADGEARVRKCLHALWPHQT